jgi:RNA polymerase sigma-70 factor, ECF subfamily
MFEDGIPTSVEELLLPDWESIVRRHGPMAFDTAWRLLGNAADAEEVVQDALLDAFRLHAQRAVTNWGGLLRHLAVRRAIDRLRTRPSVQPLACEPAAAESDRPDAAAIERELAERLRWAITKLPDREAGVLSLRYLGGMTNAEIASTLGITAGAVGVALHKARAKLRDLLTAQALTRRSTPE